MLRHPDRIISSYVLASVVLCATFAVRSPAAQQSANQPAFRPPLPGRLAMDGDILYAVNDPPESGVYRQPAGLFVVRFPGSWRLMRSIDNGYVYYTFSAEAGRAPPKQIRSGVKLVAVAEGDLFRRQQMSASAILKHFLPGILRGEPGMKLVGSVADAKLGALEAATCTLQGAWKDHAGEFMWDIFVAEKEDVAFQLICFAPAEDYASLRPTFLKIAAQSTFGRTGLVRRDQSIESHQITQKYRASVVLITGTGDDGSSWTGSGFIISRDGYVLTNYHVAYDVKTRKPAKALKAEWDASLRRTAVPAQIVGGKYKASAFQLSNYGTDVALLKIPPGNYEPMPLSRLAEVEVGDDMVALGFPIVGLLEGVSLTVTKGVVTRFNRGPQGDVESIYVDAAFTHGSSGSPSVSLVTGGVIGLNTFGQDIHLDPRFADYNDMIRYKGVVLIDAAIREFPLVCTPGLNPEGSGLDFLDCLDLSKYFVAVGSFKAAEQLALRAVSLEPQQAIARMRLGECRFQEALDQEADGDHDKAQALFAAARKAYDEALARDARQPDTLVAFAQLELQQNRLKEAADLAARAAAADPTDWQGHLLLADICLRQSRFDEALGHVEKAKAVTGGLIVNPHIEAASIYTAKRDYENARKEWAEAARISPVYLPARIGVAAYFEYVNQTDEAVAEYKRMLGDFPDNGEVLGRIGLCLNRAGRAAEAANYLSQSVKRYRAANQPPDESVLVCYGNFLLGRPNTAEAVPIFALYLFYYPRGQSAAAANLRLADIHTRHQAQGLASAHARMALALSNAPEVAQAAQQYPAAPLSLEEIKVMIGILQYPLPLAAEVVASSQLGFTIQGDAQIQQLQQSGMPPEILQAILTSLSQHPPVAGAPGNMGGATPSESAPLLGQQPPITGAPGNVGGFVPSESAPSLGQQPPITGAPGNVGGFVPSEPAPSGGQLTALSNALFAPPKPPFPPAGPASGTAGAALGTAGTDLRGTWVATGMTAQQGPFRSVIIFGDNNLYFSNTWIGRQSLGLINGRYWLENGRLILQPDGGQPFAPGFQMQGETMIMDVVNFAPGIRFTRQTNPGGSPQ